MNEIDRSNQASQYLHNVRRMLEVASIDTADASLSTAVLALAEAYLRLNPSVTANAKCHAPIFFLHILWCQPDHEGIEQAAREFDAWLGAYSPADQLEILTALTNVLSAARQVPAIYEELRDPCNINNLINAALLYACLTSADWQDNEEWNCLDIFLSEAWEANEEEHQKSVANRLQGYLETYSAESAESMFEALLNGRIITSNPDWDEI
ncbi:hypothetical protein HJG54_17785 [Leptolyngbya sp. NK1-12]|uniref:DUF416 family protein n=1 Tax=Leptolyngbya sp. NK1-12 TaxID=2547451 RepID=A0AA96WMZ3_9CYAN|nr:hypothetical protein [Leptolyngbya sp. NK1-12]WNZ24521.1 hypothetical protein HJG54_17785 [Leptolyngbya sp. NK1-12]